jgi:hypothetical protein
VRLQLHGRPGVLCRRQSHRSTCLLQIPQSPQHSGSGVRFPARVGLMHGDNVSRQCCCQLGLSDTAGCSPRVRPQRCRGWCTAERPCRIDVSNPLPQGKIQTAAHDGRMFQIDNQRSCGGDQVTWRDCGCGYLSVRAVRSFGPSFLTTIPDTAIFHSRITKLVPDKVSEAALQTGLPLSSVPALIAGLLAGDSSELSTVPGITPQVINAASRALKEAYLQSFHSVWIAAACLAACGAIGTAPVSENMWL